MLGLVILLCLVPGPSADGGKGCSAYLAFEGFLYKVFGLLVSYKSRFCIKDR